MRALLALPLAIAGMLRRRQCARPFPPSLTVFFDPPLPSSSTPFKPGPAATQHRYAFCPNLTIIDTPGFIIKAKAGEADSTPDEIMRMVKAQAQPAHRLVLFLQQSSVEWASSLWLATIQEVDPHLQRTARPRPAAGRLLPARCRCAAISSSCCAPLRLTPRPTLGLKRRPRPRP